MEWTEVSWCVTRQARVVCSLTAEHLSKVLEVRHPWVLFCWLIVTVLLLYSQFMSICLEPGFFQESTRNSFQKKMKKREKRHITSRSSQPWFQSHGLSRGSVVYKVKSSWDRARIGERGKKKKKGWKHHSVVDLTFKRVTQRKCLFSWQFQSCRQAVQVPAKPSSSLPGTVCGMVEYKECRVAHDLIRPKPFEKLC